MHTDDDDAPHRELREIWHRHVGGDDHLFDRLITRHRERQRRYHRIEHVEDVVRVVFELVDSEAVSDLDAVIAATMYHDAIYEPTHPANERASARLARRDLAAVGWPDIRCGAVARMIEGTATHLDPADGDTAVLFDADLSILGAEATDYEVYVERVRAEYTHLDDGEWNAGRRAVLDGFLRRPAIYATATGQGRWEDAARRNINAELSALPT